MDPKRYLTPEEAALQVEIYRDAFLNVVDAFVKSGAASGPVFLGLGAACAIVWGTDTARMQKDEPDVIAAWDSAMAMHKEEALRVYRAVKAEAVAVPETPMAKGPEGVQ